MPVDKSVVSSNNMRQGGAQWDIGGALTINSGGTLSVETGGMILESAADALTAHSGGGQANALPLPALINRVTTIAAGNDSVKLPASVPGLSVTVINAHATLSLQVFGISPDTINGIATGTGVAVAAGKTATFFTTVAGAWHMQLSA